jgi:hypothetical protein
VKILTSEAALEGLPLLAGLGAFFVGDLAASAFFASFASRSAVLSAAFWSRFFIGILAGDGVLYFGAFLAGEAGTGLVFTGDVFGLICLAGDDDCGFGGIT